MKEPLPLTRLPDVTQLMHYLNSSKSDGVKIEGWDHLDEDNHFYAQERSIEKVVYGLWHRWYVETKPDPSLEDITRAVHDMDGHYGALPTLRRTKDEMFAQGKEPVFNRIVYAQAKILGSGILFFRDFDEGKLTLSQDEAGCVKLMRQLLADKNNKNLDGALMTAAYEAGDMYVTNLWRVMKALGRDMTRQDYKAASESVSNFLIQGAYGWRAHTNNNLMNQEQHEAAFTLELDKETGVLTKVTFRDTTANDIELMLKDDELRDVFEKSQKKILYTGCPAVHAKTSGMTPNNPVKLCIDQFVRAGYLALFPHHAADASLRAAQKMTL